MINKKLNFWEEYTPLHWQKLKKWSSQCELEKTAHLSSETLAATTFVMTSIAQMAVWALHSTDRTPWSAVVWKRVERSGLDFNASSLAETRECRLEGAALAGVNSSTLGGRVGARRRIGVLVAAGTGAGEGGGGADFGEITEVIDMEMSLTASRQASLSCD